MIADFSLGVKVLMAKKGQVLVLGFVRATKAPTPKLGGWLGKL